ncbi:group I truncated hemoglobin [Lapillicoccus jejuensis]|uniref:Hemoglobin n=1 Tax=Lapillicoccus jejuensis TaxID=402171 RepID=A0A542E095_9MICO|nr:group 1 truncated hemoglobin [Lapillicoccus jejuensis]TQJ08699.1 hemoglobin [Lapillicoccus jejuensis]
MTTTVHETAVTAQAVAEATGGAEGASLYERLGGVYAIAGAVDILVDRLFSNVSVNANDAVHAHHGDPANAPGYKFLVTAWSVQAAGGPACYPGRDMTAAHEHLRITGEQFDAVALEISATLGFCGVPQVEHDEFMAIIERYRDEVVERG